MARLLARDPFGGLLPLSWGQVTAMAVDPGPVTLIAPYRASVGETRDRLRAELALDWPDPGRATGSGEAALLSVGPGRALLVGVPAPDLPGAAVIDQSDGVAVVAVSGADARAVLARLVPLDLDPVAFGEGSVAATLVGHMTATLWARGEALRIVGMRSMARSLVHELERAARNVAAREAMRNR
ncbi:sarcosine oxidase subunit gamma [Histidinibacterium lentulum]|uniref:sarcosine oxidase subunit gamma n=1 Tax=Histidinibacterium lentulum TaxID=2480588 RepID=UPI00160A7318|nr:sarcosine oxidase subunit gamma [Histidinibacterium lentulum]